MGKISQLLKWNHPVVLKDARGMVLMNAWVRILDDDDLEEAYRDARIYSATLRAELKDVDHPRYTDEVLKIEGATKEQAKELINAARGTNLTAEAFATVERPDLPTLDQIAVIPDAPTLEEQEKLDAAIDEINTKYTAAIDEYIEIRALEIDTELEAKTKEELITEAKDATVDLLVLTSFISRVVDEKIWRGTYDDPKFKERSFKDFAEFHTTDSGIKDQLRAAYNNLEMNPEDIKN